MYYGVQSGSRVSKLLNFPLINHRNSPYQEVLFFNGYQLTKDTEQNHLGLLYCHLRNILTAREGIGLINHLAEYLNQNLTSIIQYFDSIPL